MRPSQKGWINQDQKLYKLVQPTGLMYGHPIRPYRHYGLVISNWKQVHFIIY